ncbi:hypothetical protein SAMD00019534_005160 [Acytostelium subglobosum LB1]|uniref:hypothetical protein n=1 Tax=Acytostelium subglobosum LB1 TaxID=1410327 RepID=UPI000644C6DD|nr:hypothetical protein SAMD00019534_005160 [Acytostelium subglobosum LB1]GAM17341.1 hypothetical protein SAMD00019534_005160 [Acytostelium subglobosum LB1]|eukprot:XP_012759403.1 hypothetical protein SAMD00019534_005160 [Acytostelium subglobosum LB1]
MATGVEDLLELLDIHIAQRFLVVSPVDIGLHDLLYQPYPGEVGTLGQAFAATATATIGSTQ